jgi:hypothetical protein
VTAAPHLPMKLELGRWQPSRVLRLPSDL